MDTVDSEFKGWEHYKDEQNLHWEVTTLSDMIQSNQVDRHNE